MKPRIIIVDKVPPQLQHLAKPFYSPNGIKFELTLVKVTDIKIFLDYFNSTMDRQGGTAMVYLPSPWMYADGRQKRREELARRDKK